LQEVFMSAVQMVHPLKEFLEPSAPRLESPPCPGLVIRLRRTAARPPVNPRSIVNLIGSQAGLGWQLVSTVNDARYGLRMKHNSVLQVMTALGLSNTIAMTTALCLGPALAGLVPERLQPVLERLRLLGFASAFIAGRLPGLSRELAFVHGMFRDVGAAVRSDGVVDFSALATDAERAEIGARLAHCWGLPQVIVEAIRRRPDFAQAGAMPPATVAARTLTAVSLLAEHALACCCRLDVSPAWDLVERAAREQLSLDQQQFEDTMLEVQGVFG
jgi:HD-like signal output (HDOD) protein